MNVACPDVTVADDLLEEIRAATKGKARRIVTSLHELQTWARNHGTMAVDSAGYSGRIFTGEIPVRHRARPRKAARANGNGQAAGAA